MDYLSLYYYLLIVVLLAAYYLLPEKRRWYALLFGSICFYGFAVKKGVLLGVFAATLLVSYLCARYLQAMKISGKPERLVNRALAASIFFSALPLLYARAVDFIKSMTTNTPPFAKIHSY